MIEKWPKTVVDFSVIPLITVVEEFFNSIEIFNVSCNGLSKVTNPAVKEFEIPTNNVAWKLTAPKTAWLVELNLV